MQFLETFPFAIRNPPPPHQLNSFTHAVVFVEFAWPSSEAIKFQKLLLKINRYYPSNTTTVLYFGVATYFGRFRPSLGYQQNTAKLRLKYMANMYTIVLRVR